MKLILTAAALSLFVSVSSFALPQDNEKDKRDQPPPKERQDDKKQQEDRKQQEEKKQQDEKNKDRDRSQQDRDKSQQDRDRAQQQDRDRAPQTDRDRSSREDRDQRAGEPPRQDPNRVPQNRDQQSARNSGGHGRGQRIPDDRFRSSFGRQHTFRVQRQAGGGGQRFQYGGYYFEYVEAWPGDWSYDDDFYIESMGDDYYLYDLRHPEMRILVIVVE
jgi:hypothetical protein